MGWLIFFGVIILVIFLIYKAVEGQNNKDKERRETIQQKLSGIENFTISRRVEGIGSLYIFAIDEINEKIALVTQNHGNHIFSFSDIIGVELIANGKTTVSKRSTTRTIGGAIVGSVLGGGAGAIVGGLSGNTKTEEKITIFTVKFLLRSIEKSSITFLSEPENANKIKDIVSIIIDRIDNRTEAKPVEVETKQSNSIADEILKLNKLKEKGILTEEEFTLQKNKILN